MNQKVIDALNQSRERELEAILQYMAEHYELDDVGYEKLGTEMKQTAITEMKHAEELAERVLFLGGVPSYKPHGEIRKGMSIQDMIQHNLDLETGAVKMYNDFAKLCAAEGDHISKTIFEKLLSDEEKHVDDFQKTKDHIEKLGDVYIATLIG